MTRFSCQIGQEGEDSSMELALSFPSDQPIRPAVLRAMSAIMQDPSTPDTTMTMEEPSPMAHLTNYHSASPISNDGFASHPIPRSQPLLNSPATPFAQPMISPMSFDAATVLPPMASPMDFGMSTESAFANDPIWQNANLESSTLLPPNDTDGSQQSTTFDNHIITEPLDIDFSTEQQSLELSSELLNEIIAETAPGLNDNYAAGDTAVPSGDEITTWAGLGYAEMGIMEEELDRAHEEFLANPGALDEFLDSNPPEEANAVIDSDAMVEDGPCVSGNDTLQSPIPTSATTTPTSPPGPAPTPSGAYYDYSPAPPPSTPALDGNAELQQLHAFQVIKEEDITYSSLTLYSLPQQARERTKRILAYADNGTASVQAIQRSLGHSGP